MMTSYIDVVEASNGKLLTAMAAALSQSPTSSLKQLDTRLASDEILYEVVKAVSEILLTSHNVTIDQISGRIQTKIQQIGLQNFVFSDTFLKKLEVILNKAIDSNEFEASKESVIEILQCLNNVNLAKKLEDIYDFLNSYDENTDKQTDNSDNANKTDKTDNKVLDKFYKKYHNKSPFLDIKLMDELLKNITFFDDFFNDICSIIRGALDTLHPKCMELITSTITLTSANILLIASTINLTRSNLTLAASNIMLALSNFTLTAANGVLAASLIVLMISNLILKGSNIILAASKIALALAQFSILFSIVQSILTTILSLILSAVSIAMSVLFSIAMFIVSFMFTILTLLFAGLGFAAALIMTVLSVAIAIMSAVIGFAAALIMGILIVGLIFILAAILIGLALIIGAGLIAIAVVAIGGALAFAMALIALLLAGIAFALVIASAAVMLGLLIVMSALIIGSLVILAFQFTTLFVLHAALCLSIITTLSVLLLASLALVLLAISTLEMVLILIALALLLLIFWGIESLIQHIRNWINDSGIGEWLAKIKDWFEHSTVKQWIDTLKQEITAAGGVTPWYKKALDDFLTNSKLGKEINKWVIGIRKDGFIQFIDSEFNILTTLKDVGSHIGKLVWYFIQTKVLHVSATRPVFSSQAVAKKSVKNAENASKDVNNTPTVETTSEPAKKQPPEQYEINNDVKTIDDQRENRNEEVEAAGNEVMEEVNAKKQVDAKSEKTASDKINDVDQKVAVLDKKLDSTTASTAEGAAAGSVLGGTTGGIVGGAAKSVVNNNSATQENKR